ncbi:MAG: hypothetical protein AB3N16_13005 [Flavobacteriaceae bacterium]
MKIRGFKLQRNKSFKYVPRYGKDAGEGAPLSFDSSFSKYRDAHNPNDMRSVWRQARTEGRSRNNREVNRRLLIIIAVLVLVVLWVFDFDLSVFF